MVDDHLRHPLGNTGHGRDVSKPARKSVQCPERRYHGSAERYAGHERRYPGCENRVETGYPSRRNPLERTDRWGGGKYPGRENRVAGKYPGREN